MNENSEIKVERSIPVQSRVNLVELAMLDRYFSELGEEIRSMSQLLSWGISLLVETLEANNVLPTKFESLVEANRYLNMRGLYQPGMKSRGRKKLGTALGFESMRGNGINPRNYVKQQFNTIHGNEEKNMDRPWIKDKSIAPFEGKVVSGKEEEGMHYKDEIDEAFRRIEEEKKKERDAELKTAIESMRSQGHLAEESTSGFREGISDEELREYNKDRDKKIRERENAPIDTTGMVFAEEVR